MADFAKVDSIDALVAFKPHVLTFAKVARSALDEAIAEARKLQAWLEHEQQAFWKREISLRQEQVRQARDAYMEKKMNRSLFSAHHSGVEERQALKRAEDRLAVARERLAMCKSWSLRLQTAIDQFIGQVSQLAGAAESGLPEAAVHLQRGIDMLRAYAKTQTLVEDDAPAHSPEETP